MTYNNVKFENGYFNYYHKINANTRVWYWVILVRLFYLQKRIS